ncbi:hypothetical protein BZG35_16940 [Brevundimonas sp. LM2]|nr:hypothetical protein BZG35_16940 [Brevundimonas sp. LM2]
MASILRRAPRTLAAALAVALASLMAPASHAAAHSPADPFTVDDLLRNENFGAIRVSPDERYVLFERQGPYDTAERFDLAYFARWTTSELWVADLTQPRRVRPLLGQADRRGVVMGEFSPNGRRLVVHRLQHDRWETGVVELVSGTVDWLGLGAEPPFKGETTLWRTDDELILVARSDGDLPYEIGALSAAARHSRDWRDAAALGGVATTVWGAGAHAQATGSGAQLTTWRIDLASGARTRLAAGQTLDLALSVTGRWLAIVDRGAPEPVAPEEPLRPADQAEARRLKVLDLTTDQTWLPCGTCDVASGLLGWSADDRLLVWERGGSGQPTQGRLLAIAPGSRSVAPISLERVEPDVGQTRDTRFQTVRAAWLGAQVILLGRSAGNTRLDWHLAGARPLNLTRGLPAPPGGLEAISTDAFLTFADGSLWSVDRNGRSVRLPAPGTVTAVTTLTHWASPRRRLNSPLLRDWTLGRASDGSLWRLGADGSSHRISAQASPDLRATGRGLAIDVSLENGVETLRLLGPDQTPTPLVAVNQAYGRIAFAEALPVTTPGAGDGVGQSWLYAPPGGLVPGTPLIIVAYPGASVRPSANPAEFSTMANVQLLAGLGYAVLTPALPGTSADGPAAHLTDRIVSALDAALAQYPDLDGDRVGYVGHSFGGYTGLVLATQTSRIRSFVIMSAPSNLASGWGGFGGLLRQNPEFGHAMMRRLAGWSEAGQGAIGGPPWQAPEAYVANTPLFDADRIDAPVLLIHGDLDFVGVGEAESLFTALWRQNKDVQLVTYWGEQHLFYSPGTVRDLWHRLEAWLKLTLGPPARASLPTAALPSDESRPPPTRPPGFPVHPPASGDGLHPGALP